MDKKYWNGAEAAHRRVMMKACGYSDRDIRTKPIIGVPNAYMEGSPGFAHLRPIVQAIKEGIWAAGGVPVEFGIPATCGNIALVQDGDIIEIDIKNSSVNLLVSDEILKARRKKWVQPELKEQKGVLNIYAKMCRSPEEGGAMQPWELDAKYSDLK